MCLSGEMVHHWFRFDIHRYYCGWKIYMICRGFSNKSKRLGKGSEKKPVFFMVFCQTRGRGVSEGSKKTILLFWKIIFFQRACRIILGPQKHVLHLVWSPYVIYTAIRTALKVACKARILGKRRSISKNKKIKFWNGTKRKICFTHLWSYFRKKK